jgi:hypothetical protein
VTDALRLALVRAVHTAIYVVMAGSVFAVFYAGLVGAHGRWLFVALALVAIEIVVFVGNGLKCPLTAIATKYGAAPGADTFLPERLTRYTLTFFGPLIAISLIMLLARWWGVLK